MEKTKLVQITDQELENISGGMETCCDETTLCSTEMTKVEKFEEQFKQFIKGFTAPLLFGPYEIVCGFEPGHKPRGVGFTLCIGGLILGSAAAGIGVYEGVKRGIKKIKSRRK